MSKLDQRSIAAKKDASIRDGGRGEHRAGEFRGAENVDFAGVGLFARLPFADHRDGSGLVDDVDPGCGGDRRCPNGFDISHSSLPGRLAGREVRRGDHGSLVHDDLPVVNHGGNTSALQPRVFPSDRERRFAKIERGDAVAWNEQQWRCPCGRRGGAAGNIERREELTGSCGNEFNSVGILKDEGGGGQSNRDRRGPSRATWAGASPKRLAGFEINAAAKRVALVFELNGDHIIEDDGRTAHRDIVARSRMVDRESSIPERSAVGFQANQVARAEQGDNFFTVAGGRWGCVGTGRMRVGPAECMQRSQPQTRSIECGKGFDVQISLILASTTGHHHAVANHDGTADATSGSGNFPGWLH